MPIVSQAYDRHVLRAMTTGLTGSVLVIGRWRTVEDLLFAPNVPVVDVAGTDPRVAATTVVSEARGAGSLPRERWDAVIVTETKTDLLERLLAATDACRRGGLVLVCASIRAPEVQTWLATNSVRLANARPVVRPRWLLARRV